MKSLNPTLLIAMLSGIFQGFTIVCIGAAIVKQEPAFIIFAGFCTLISLLFWGFSYDRAKELREWIDPAKEFEFLQTIPQDAVDRQWIKEVEETYNNYIYTYGAYCSDALTQAKYQIDVQAKDAKIRALLSAAKATRGIRLPKTSKSEE